MDYFLEFCGWEEASGQNEPNKTPPSLSLDPLPRVQATQQVALSVPTTCSQVNHAPSYLKSQHQHVHDKVLTSILTLSLKETLPTPAAIYNMCPWLLLTAQHFVTHRAAGPHDWPKKKRPLQFHGHLVYLILPIHSQPTGLPPSLAHYSLNFKGDIPQWDLTYEEFSPLQCKSNSPKKWLLPSIVSHVTNLPMSSDHQTKSIKEFNSGQCHLRRLGKPKVVTSFQCSWSVNNCPSVCERQPRRRPSTSSRNSINSPPPLSLSEPVARQVTTRPVRWSSVTEPHTHPTHKRNGVLRWIMMRSGRQCTSQKKKTRRNHNQNQ